ncbi:hypothetical protein BGW80DRAFT_1543566, partial [Lactifluus volemus]
FKRGSSTFSLEVLTYPCRRLILFSRQPTSQGLTMARGIQDSDHDLRCSGYVNQIIRSLRHSPAVGALISAKIRNDLLRPFYTYPMGNLYDKVDKDGDVYFNGEYRRSRGAGMTLLMEPRRNPTSLLGRTGTSQKIRTLHSSWGWPPRSL